MSKHFYEIYITATGNNGPKRIVTYGPYANKFDAHNDAMRLMSKISNNELDLALTEEAKKNGLKLSVVLATVENISNERIHA